jgi:FkbM family methyltransferase
MPPWFDRLRLRLRRRGPRADFGWSFVEAGDEATLTVTGARPVRFDAAQPPVRDWLRKKHADGAMHEPAFAFVLLELLRRLEPRVYFDVGALWGYFSLLPAAARPGLEVKTFEMNPETFRCLERNVARNPELAPAIRLANTALGGKTALGRPIWYSGMRLRDAPAEGFREAMVDVLTLDHLMGQGLVPDLVKIDVEGFEAPVLRGAARLLAERKPALLYELHKESLLAPHDASRRSVTRSLLDAGYRLFAVDHHRDATVSARPLRPVARADDPAIGGVRNNAFVALPPELVPRLDGLVAG